MGNPITVQEVLQLLLSIRVGYPKFAQMVDVDGFIEVYSGVEGNDIPIWLWERTMWIMTRFAQFLYKFPIQSEMDARPHTFTGNPNCQC